MKFRNRKTKMFMGRATRVFFAAVFIIIFGVAGISHAAAAAQQKTFPSAENAVKALIAAAKSNDDKEMLANPSVPAQKR